MYRSPSERASAPRSQRSTACFSVTADAAPGIMPRVLELFARRGLTPSVWHATVNLAGELTIDVQMAGMDGPAARQVAQCLRQIYGVDCVLTAEKAAAGR